MRAILVSVDFADLLAITLPHNRHHFKDVCIVTTPSDQATLDVAAANKAKVFATNAFYDDGAMFNKWKALEQGLDYFERKGWLCIMDADILWPRRIPLTNYERGCLYTPHRRILHNPAEWAGQVNWSRYPVKHEQEFAGYTQIFHATDTRLGKPPWHEITWRHAGGADSFFQRKWPPGRKVRPRFEVLHLGDPSKNWCGRAVPYVDGTQHPDAEQRVAKLREFIENRTQGPTRFDGEKLPKNDIPTAD